MNVAGYYIECLGVEFEAHDELMRTSIFVANNLKSDIAFFPGPCILHASTASSCFFGELRKNRNAC